MGVRRAVLVMLAACGHPAQPPQPQCAIASAAACPMIEFLPPAGAIGGGLGAIAVGDVNCDGFGDVVTSHGAVYLGSPAGLVVQDQLLDIDGANALAIVDADGDGHYDLLAVRDEVEPNGAPAPGSLRIALGTGDGGFNQPFVYQTYQTGGYPAAIGTGDFDGDGVLDIVVANSGDKNVSLFTGRGGGRFALHRKFPTAVGGYGHPTRVAVADLDRDGNLDVVVGYAGLAQLDLLRGDGDGNLSASNPIAYASLTAFRLRDVNEDGQLDLVMTVGDTVVVALGTGPLAFGAPTSYPAGPVPLDVEIADLDGDGHVDLAIANSTVFGAGLGYVTVLRGNGDGTFVPYRMYPSGYGTAAVAVTDFDGDGRPDLAVTEQYAPDGLYLLHAACP